ncbi:MAG: HDIG domain-containing protein [Bacteroidia bacterium]|nr:HDIG domain-containing protein [Bacteroidia bacterium]
MSIQINDQLLPSWLIEAMKATDQNPTYHAEGNVWNHTKLVQQAFEAHHKEFDLTESEKEVLNWASLLHDAGKPATTKWKINRWVSHGHEEAGIPFARNILFNSGLTQQQQRQVLELVKYHSIPLHWMLKGKPFDAYKSLAIKTDIRLLAIFFYFDILGRNCVGKDRILELCKELNEKMVPKLIYEWGSHGDIQAAYQKASVQQKNALWNSLKFEDRKLTWKLLQAKPPQTKPATFKIFMTVSIPDSQKKAYLEEHYGDYNSFPLEGLNLEHASVHQRSNYLRQVKHFISVWGRIKKPILITGELTNESTRRELASFCRDLGAELTYLYFEEKDPGFENYQLPKSRSFLDIIHPWETHKIEYIRL